MNQRLCVMVIPGDFSSLPLPAHLKMDDVVLVAVKESDGYFHFQDRYLADIFAIADQWGLSAVLHHVGQRAYTKWFLNTVEVFDGAAG